MYFLATIAVRAFILATLSNRFFISISGQGQDYTSGVDDSGYVLTIFNHTETHSEAEARCKGQYSVVIGSKKIEEIYPPIPHLEKHDVWLRLTETFGFIEEFKRRCKNKCFKYEDRKLLCDDCNGKALAVCESESSYCTMYHQPTEPNVLVTVQKRSTNFNDRGYVIERSEIWFTCGKSHQVPMHPISVCHGGKWDIANPNCTTFCTGMANSSNFGYVYSWRPLVGQKYPVGARVTTSCQRPGYFLPGEKGHKNTRHCESSGKWSQLDATLRCEPYCTRPQQLSGTNSTLVNDGQLKELYRVGDQLFYSCLDGYELQTDDNASTCVQSKPDEIPKWSKIPFCALADNRTSSADTKNLLGTIEADNANRTEEETPSGSSFSLSAKIVAIGLGVFLTVLVLALTSIGVFVVIQNKMGSVVEKETDDGNQENPEGAQNDQEEIRQPQAIQTGPRSRKAKIKTQRFEDVPYHGRKNGLKYRKKR